MRPAIAAALACLSGCVPMVSHYHVQLPTRRNVEKAMTRCELQGMTREEVLLRFGEPDSGSPETFEYAWTRVWMLFILPPGWMIDDYRLTLSFEDERVARVRATSEWSFSLGHRGFNWVPR